MPIKRAAPDLTCRHCGKPNAVSYYRDGSYAGEWHDGRCEKGPPGPPSFPVRYPEGAHYPATPDAREIGRLKGEVAYLRSYITDMRKTTLEALGVKLPLSQELATDAHHGAPPAPPEPR
jgi:hypothetical protein